VPAVHPGPHTVLDLPAGLVAWRAQPSPQRGPGRVRRRRAAPHLPRPIRAARGASRSGGHPDQDDTDHHHQPEQHRRPQPTTSATPATARRQAGPAGHPDGYLVRDDDTGITYVFGPADIVTEGFRNIRPGERVRFLIDPADPGHAVYVIRLDLPDITDYYKQAAAFMAC